MITSRGNPDGPTLAGQEIEPVHWRVSGDGLHGPRPACNNGAFNIRWSSDRSEVTCEKCQEKAKR